jgi:hypothetical protein
VHPFVDRVFLGGRYGHEHAQRVTNAAGAALWPAPLFSKLGGRLLKPERDGKSLGSTTAKMER